MNQRSSQPAAGRCSWPPDGFSKGAFFDPEVGRTALYVGFADHPPRYDAQRSIVKNTVVETDVVEGTWREVTLEPGRYWLLESNSPEITLRTCDGGVSRVRKAPLPNL